MLIRPARVDEAVLLSSIAFESKSLWGYGRAQLEQWRADLTVSGEQIAACPTWVAEAEGRIAGFCMLAPALPHWQLEHLWVRPECAGAGVGRILLGKAASLAASSEAASLAASSEAARLAIDADPNAEAFYIACGATRIGAVAAPIEGAPERFRPQLLLALALFDSPPGSAT